MSKPFATLAALAIVAAASAQASAQASAGTATDSTARSEVIRLITGDRVLVRTVDGRRQAVVAPASTHGIAADFRRERVGNHNYVFPAAACRYLSRFLDPGLFDVDRLLTAETAGRVPVRLSYAAGSVPHVPGLTITGRGSGSATGYLAPSGQSAFRRALVAQWERDSTAGASAPKTLLGLSHVSLAAGGAPVAVHPNYPMVTLKLRVLDEFGKPLDSGSVTLMNTDNAQKFSSDVEVDNGVGRASVPLGHYSAMAAIYRFDPSTNIVTAYLVPVADYAVTRNLQLLTFDARKASATPTVQTPKPATLNVLNLEWDRLDASGNGGDSLSFGFFPGSYAHIAPTPAATVGRMEYLTDWQLASAPATGNPYTYDLAFRDVGVPADQSRTVAAAQLARVNASYYADGNARVAGLARFPLYRFQIFGGGWTFPFAAPAHRTEYVLTANGAAWSEEYVADYTHFLGVVDDGLRRYFGGEVRTAQWLRGPLAPGILARTNGDASFDCQACRTDKNIAVDFAPVVDTIPGHDGQLDASDGPVSRFRFYRNGTLIDDERGVTGGQFAVPSSNATYRAIVQTERPAFSTSTSATLDVAFRSAAGHGGQLPAGWRCRPLAGKACRVLPLLRVRMPLPTDLNGTMPVGHWFFTFNVDHVQGAARSAVTSVTLQTSVDGGKTWQTASTQPVGGGRYLAMLNNPRNAFADFVNVRVHATDAAGGWITETVNNAYTIGAD